MTARLSPYPVRVVALRLPRLCRRGSGSPVGRRPLRCIVERVTRLPGQNRGSGTYGVAVRRREPNGEPAASVAAGASWLFPGRLSPGRPTAEAEPALPAWQHDLPDADGGARIRAPPEERVRLRSVLSGGGLSGLKQLHIDSVPTTISYPWLVDACRSSGSADRGCPLNTLGGLAIQSYGSY
jgi:hypothetical protein